MTIKDLFVQLEGSSHPVAKAIHKGAHFKVLVIGFKSGMILKEHQANLPAHLTVLEGQVKYKTKESQIVLDQYDEMEIPLHEIHSVEAIKDSFCLLTQG